MAVPMKSGVRSMLFTMINNYNQIKSDTDTTIQEKQQLLTDILSVTDGIDDINVKERVKDLVRQLEVLVQNVSLSSETQYLSKISSMTGISVRSLRRIKKEGSMNQGIWNTPGKKRPRKPTVSNLDDFDISAIRNKINEFYCVKKKVPTLRTLLTDLRESIGFTGHRSTLRRILHKNGFEFKRYKNERSMLIENYEISAWRHRYLRIIAEKRQQGKLIVYLDETYIHQNYKLKKSWQGPSTSGVMDKISLGKRHIIIHAGSEKSFVPNALLVLSTKSKMADYHDDMNKNIFLRWLEEMLLPNLLEPCVIQILESDFDYSD